MDDRASLKKTRSLLLLLLATCKETQLTLEATANTLDAGLTSDVAAMIQRTERELVALTEKLQASPE